MRTTIISATALLLLTATWTVGHDGGHTPAIVHSGGNAMPPLPSKVTIEVKDGVRTITSTGLPDHWHGRFPNAGNPNPIVPQNVTFRMPAVPSKATNPVPSHGPIAFGVALNGVPFEPSAAEFWKSDRNSGWQYEALTDKLNLGLDDNHAHVQPNGKYHYHGIPTGLLKDGGKAAVIQLIGYAADGYPIYGPWGHAEPMDASSPLRLLKPGYRIKNGPRPSGDQGPGGNYDGTFVQDFVFAPELGDLDEFNGRFGVTPEHPKGTYYYVVTTTWPYIPRQFRGEPDDSFRFGPGANRGTQRQLAGPPERGGPGGPRRGGPPTNDPLSLLANRSVASELRLEPSQHESLRRLADSSRSAGRAARSAGGSREPQDIRDRMKALREQSAKQLDEWISKNFDTAQQSRWRQLLRQQQGMDFFISEEAKQLLAYGDAQFAELYTTLVMARKGITITPMPITGNEAAHATWQAITKLLTPQQAKTLQTLLGKRVSITPEGPPPRRR